MPKVMSPAVGVSLPSLRGNVVVVLGPAMHSQGKWALPLLLHNQAGAVTERELQRGILAYRSTLGYAPRFSRATPKAEAPE
jgi:hypothetical protein